MELKLNVTFIATICLVELTCIQALLVTGARTDKRLILQPASAQIHHIQGCKDTNDTCAFLRCDDFPLEAKLYCPATCGYCPKTSLCHDSENITIARDCKYLRCDDFPDEANVYCQKTCGRCTKCEDAVQNCSAYGPEVCSRYRNWSVMNCARTCEICDCFDMLHNCSDIGPWVCNFSRFAAAQCSKYCNVCDDIYHPYAHLAGPVIVPDLTSILSTQTPSLISTSLPIRISTTTPLIDSHSCNKIGVISAVAQEKPITEMTSSTICKDGSHGASEVIPQHFCNVPVTEIWKQGERIMDNCSRIHAFTPISTFLFGSYPHSDYGISGVFLSCEPNGIKAVIQMCGGAPNIVHLVSGDPQYIQNADNYFSINW